MTIALLFVVAGLAVCVLLLFGATVELYRQILQIRKYLGMVDETRVLEFNSSVVVRDLSIPVASELDGDGRSAILILSDRCTTCWEIARHLPREPSPALMVLVESGSAADATAWMVEHDLAEGPNVVYDEDGEIARELGVNVSPAVVRLEGVRPVNASTISSTGQLDRLLEWIASGMTVSSE